MAGMRGGRDAEANERTIQCCKCPNAARVIGDEGFAIEAKDGAIGTIRDFLFDQATWTVRWLVIDTGR